MRRGLGPVTAETDGEKEEEHARPREKASQSDARVEDLLGPIRDEHHLPGLIGAICFGAKSRGPRRPRNPQDRLVSARSRSPTRCTSGSCTKAMTATMIGSLVEEGKLSWKSTFRTIFPESADQFHPQFQEATLSHLLTHRAGLPHDGPWWNLPGTTTTQARHALMIEHAATSAR